MNRVLNRATLTFSSVLTISEEEIRALDALVGYGDDAFLKAFSEKLGAAYMRDHEGGLRSFFQTVREQVLPALADVNQAREDIRAAIQRRDENRRQVPAKVQP